MLFCAAAALLFAAVACFAGCQNGGRNGDQNGGQGGGQGTFALKGIVRTVSFAGAQEDIYYGGEVIGRSAADGSFEIQAPAGKSDEELTAQIGLAGDSLTYTQYTSEGLSLVIVRLGEGMAAEDFYFLSGKVVLHSDGETVAAGAELRIDGTPVKAFSDDRNFDVGLVHKDSIVSVYKEGWESIDANLIPYNDVCFAEKLAGVRETTELTANGAKTAFKHLTGVTFRLREAA